jgi:hypothetical protein
MSVLSTAQIGGRFAFESASLPSSARLTALGGSLISVQDNDLALAQLNPALSNVLQNNQLSINHNFHFAGISFSNVAFGKTFDSLGISTHVAVQNVSYGTFDLTDEVGNINGEFSASEIGIVLGAAKQLNERIRAGVNLKFLNSNYEAFGSVALGLDIGLLYNRSEESGSWGLVLRNIGRELTAVVDETRALPFDLQLGYSKKLKHLPFRISIIGHNLQKWYIRYDDPDFDNESTLTGEITSVGSFSRNLDNLFRHVIINGEFLLGKNEQMRLRFGYNHLRKQEMRLTAFRSLAGFSAGIGFNIKKIMIDYGVGYYHIAGANNHISIRLNMDRIMSRI